MRLTAVLVSGLLLCLLALKQEKRPVRVELSRGGPRLRYRIGEPILLVLTFVSSEPGFSLDTTTTEPASSIDAITVSPMKGVFPWLDDRARGHLYRPDYSALTMLQVGKPEKITLPLNAVYRF